MSKLEPHHPSMRGVRRKPYGLDQVKLTPEAIELCERASLEVFSLMTMNGHTFVQALAAVYLTGLNHGGAASRPAERRSAVIPT